MKTRVFLISLLVSMPIYAKYTWDIEKAKRSCEIQKGSLFRAKQGTPACQKLAELRHLQWQYENQQRERHYQERQKEEYEARVRAVQNENPRAIKNEIGQGYAWNPHERKYCYHNSDGYPYKCH